MKAIEVNGIIDKQGHLSVDEPLIVNQSGHVRVIILFDEDVEELEPAIAGFRQGWQDAMTGNTIPVSQLWERLDAD